ncbi:MAG: DNA primase [Clostridia bacterium]
MAIPPYFIQELKSRISIEEVVSSYVNLKRRGKNMLGLCPFHNEKTPSFNVSPENGYFHCFGCGAGGDIITFVMKIENLDYLEAVRFLADRAGLQVPESGADNSMSMLRARVLEINRETARFFHSALMSDAGKNALAYFTNRKLSPKIIRHFGLGYASDGRFDLVNHLKKLGYKKEEMDAANLAFISKNGNPVDRFNSRVMFPIIDLRGNVVAFGGRILTDEKPKYINSSDTPVYHKSQGLFAMNFAKNSKDTLILAEGYMDVIVLHQAGFTGAIASLGTALTTEQAKIITKYSKEIVICYDSDEAGKKATTRAIPILRTAGLAVKIITIPDGKDPDEFIKKGGKDGAIKFRHLVDNAKTDIEYLMGLEKIKYNLETEQGKVSYLTACAEILGNVDNSIERDVYMGKLSAEIGVQKTSIDTQVQKKITQTEKVQQKKFVRERQKNITGIGDRTNPEKAKNLRIATAEESLLAYIFTNPDGVDFCKEKISPENFLTSFCKRVYLLVLGKNISSQAISLSDIAGDLSTDEMAAMSRILIKFADIVISPKDASDYIDLIKKEGAFSNAESIKKADASDLADYLKVLKERKK